MKILISIRIHITTRPRRNHISPQKHTSLVTSDIMSELGDQLGNVDATEEERTRQANEHQEKIRLYINDVNAHREPRFHACAFVFDINPHCQHCNFG